MKKFRNYSLKEYTLELSKKEPVPGGGSAAALVAATGTSLIIMVANYSLDKGKSKAQENKFKKIIKDGTAIRNRLLELVDLDAEAYLGVVKARGKSKAEKNKAKRKAKAVPKETAKLCYKAIQLGPYLVEHGNKHLLSDVEVAVETLFAAFNSAMINVEINA